MSGYSPKRYDKIGIILSNIMANLLAYSNEGIPTSIVNRAFAMTGIEERSEVIRSGSELAPHLCSKAERANTEREMLSS
jgi:hypothetical protein